MLKLRSLVVLAVTTWAFVVCFAVWLMFGVTGIPISRELNLNGLEFGLLTSTPVLTGALFRLPLGIWTDRFGGRIVMFLLLVVSAVPLWLSSYANQFWQFLLLGLALGVVGASFAVGTPYVARFFQRSGEALPGDPRPRPIPYRIVRGHFHDAAVCTWRRIGMASTFKYVGDDFPDNMGIVTGIVGLTGGLGGFVLPILFGAILDWLGINSSCFMFLYGIVWVLLILNYTTEVRRLPVMGEQVLIGATSIPSVTAVASSKTGARP